MNTIGRRPNPIDYRDVSYNGKEYVVGTVLFNYEPVEFVIDREDFDKIKDRAWHVSSGQYISSAFVDGHGSRKEVYLHNIIMDRPLFLGKGQKETVDHINRNGFDNRKENLRILSQSLQNMNQRKKPRNVELPAGCGIEADEIPKHIWYIHANGEHGDRFAIEFKTENICWKCTSSKKVSLRDKLQQTKQKLAEFYTTYPHLNPLFETTKIAELTKTFQEITDK